MRLLGDEAAAQREALIGQLQAQLATVRLHDQQLQQQVQAEREQHQAPTSEQSGRRDARWAGMCSVMLTVGTFWFQWVLLERVSAKNKVP